VGRASGGLGGGTVDSMRFRGLIDRIRGLDPRLADALIAFALAVAIELQFALGNQPGSEADAVNLIGGLMVAAPLAWRRRAPLAMICVFAAATVANEALGGGMFSFPDETDSGGDFTPVASLLTGAIAFYSLGAHAEDGDARVGVALGLAGFWATVIVSGPIDFESFFFSAALAVTPWLVGRNVRARRLRLAAAEREQEQRTRLAVGDERTRIARELHDVVAHSVGVIVVQAQGARRVFDRDPERAREALGSIEQTARKALTEMRRSLGVLRDEERSTMLEPQPGIDDLEGLLEQAREGGLTVELAVEGEPRTLPRSVDLSAYRILQEALTNTIKHAGCAPGRHGREVRSRVAVRYGERELELEVSDDGPGSSVNGAERSSGHGLVGMRERVASHGGELHLGSSPDGGFVVRASLPLGE
jgi:signal transduction histidine kinase